MQEKYWIVFPLKSNYDVLLRKLSILVFYLYFSYQIVEKFAKSTGDFSRLAQTDLLIIALTYDLQKEVGGVDSVNINCLFDVLCKIDYSHCLEKSHCRC